MLVGNDTQFPTDIIYTNLTADLKAAAASDKLDVMMILQMLIASVGIVADVTVIFAFLNH